MEWNKDGDNYNLKVGELYFPTNIIKDYLVRVQKIPKSKLTLTRIEFCYKITNCPILLLKNLNAYVYYHHTHIVNKQYIFYLYIKNILLL